MGKFEQQILSAAQEGAEMSGSTLGSQLLSKLTSGTADPALVHEDVKQHLGSPNIEKEIIKEEPKREVFSPHSRARNHSGNGRQADRSALAEEMVDLKKIQERIKKDLERFEADKAIVNSEIIEIKSRIKEAEGLGQSSAVKNWGIRLKKAEDMLKVIEKSATTIDPISDKAILSELHAYRHARNKQAQAEIKMNNAGDSRAMGDYNRAEAEAFAISQKIEGLVKERRERDPWSISDTIKDQGIFYTHEQAVADKEDWGKKHNIQFSEPSLILAQEESPAQVEIEPKVHEEATKQDSKEIAEFSGLSASEVMPVTSPKKESEQNELISSPTEKSIDTPQEIVAQIPADEVTPEINEDTIPVLTEAVEVPLGTPEKGQGAAFAKFESLVTEGERKESAEDRKERILRAIYKYHNVELPERAKKAGMSEKMLDIMRAGGEVYKELPLKQKLFVSLTLFGIAYTAGGTVASLAIGGSFFQRALGGLATFVGVEGLLKASAEKGGTERTEARVNFHTGTALLAGFLVGGGALGHAIQNVFNEALPAHISHEVSGGTSPKEVQIPTTSVSPDSYVGVAEAGDSRWSLVERALSGSPYKDEFGEMSKEQQTYVIDAIKDRLTDEMTEAEADTLKIGDKIDFKEIFADKDFMGSTLSHAHNLTPEELTNIQGQAGAAILPEAEITPVTTDVPEVHPGEPGYEKGGLLEERISEVSPGEPGYEKGGLLEERISEVSPGEPGYEKGGSVEERISEVSPGEPGYEKGGSVEERTPDVMEKEPGYELGGLIEEQNQPLHTEFEPPAEAETKQGEQPRERVATTSVIPQEIHPAVPAEVAQMEAHADAVISNDIDKLFGSPKFLWFGHTSGLDSMNWKDSQVGFGGKTVTEIMEAKPQTTKATSGRTFGVENLDATSKMQSYITNVRQVSGVNPNANEKIMDFIRRASISKLSK